MPCIFCLFLKYEGINEWKLAENVLNPHAIHNVDEFVSSL